MSCYFLIDVYFDENEDKSIYANYIEKVKPIVESYGGRYLARTENIVALNEERNPSRVIIIQFPTKDRLYECFRSDEYKEIIDESIEKVDARGVIVESD